jgi:hypothetical protein
MNRGDFFAVIFGRINYSDVFGVEHWTQFCQLGSDYQPPENATTEISNMPDHPGDKCMAYNQVDKK